ncbi:MAG TPA: MBL fold metallo-hydrolase, partial [Deferrisomatales bacterium]|nr:MBL fold metallo-hydrolase [Deferrisomatales bacterium]
MADARLTGPDPGVAPGPQRLATGVWLSSGRTAVVEGPEVLAVIDPGDEPVGSAGRPLGALAETLALERQRGKPVGFLICTHGHEDHIANLGLFREAFPRASVVAHPAGPCAPDRPVKREGALPGLGEVRLIPVLGHSPWGDDLALHVPWAGTLFSGDLVQPKGDTWEQAFYPSPYPYFVDGGSYCTSLERLLQLEFAVLITGHREVRRGAAARGWVALTLETLRRVEGAVRAWPDGERDAAAPRIWQTLADA